MVRYRRIILLLILLCSVAAFPVSAKTYISPMRFLDARTLAMGGVQGPTAEGVSALFTNPAGIVRKNEFQTTGIGAGLNAQFDPEFIDAAQQYAQEFDGDFENPTEVLSHADFSDGVGFSESYTLGAAFFGLGAGLNFSNELQVSQYTTDSDALIDYRSGFSIAYGGSFKIPLGDNKLYIGANAKNVYQAMAREYVETDNVAQLLGDDQIPTDLPAVLGTGFGFDAGVIYDADPFILSLSFRDIGETKLQSYQSDLGYMQEMTRNVRDNVFDLFLGDPSFIMPEPSYTGTEIDARVIPTTIVFGAGFDVDLMNVLRMELLGDFTYYPVYAEGTDTIWQNIHLGTELDILDIFQVRAGINQGYLTGGIGISFMKFFNLLNMTLDLTYYSWEAGNFAGHRQSEAIKCDIRLSI